jgi:hypothetical protein
MPLFHWARGKAFEQSFAIAALTTIGTPQVNLVHAN